MSKLDTIHAATAIDRLRTGEKEEVQHHLLEIRSGEPPFPQYAYDVLEVLDALPTRPQQADPAMEGTRQ